MGKWAIIRIFKQAGIPRKKHSIRDYELCKRELRKLGLPPYKYEWALEWAAEYCGI